MKEFRNDRLLYYVVVWYIVIAIVFFAAIADICGVTLQKEYCHEKMCGRRLAVCIL